MPLLEDRLRRMVDGVPDQAQITLPASLLRQWIEETGAKSGGEVRREDPDSRSLPDAGVTVAEVAEHFGREPSTVRGWLGEGRFPNAWHLGREWRIPRSDLAAFVEGHGAANGNGKPAPEKRKEPELTGGGDLAAWRKERNQ